MGRDSPRARARPAYEWRRSWIRTSSRPAHRHSLGTLRPPGLGDVDPGSRRIDPHPEAGELLVPEHRVLMNFQLSDHAVRKRPVLQLRHVRSFLVFLIHQAYDRVAAAAKSEEWEELKEIGKGGKVDRLAVDPEGRLVIVELKYASASAYNYSPRRLSTFRLTKMSTVVR